LALIHHIFLTKHTRHLFSLFLYFFLSFSIFFLLGKSRIQAQKGQEHNTKHEKENKIMKNTKEVKTRMKGTKWGAKESV